MRSVDFEVTLLLGRIRFICLLAAALICPAAAPAAGGYAVTTLLLVRHAEKAESPKDDPPLTPAGHRRAEALLALARRAGVEAIFATNRIRTQQTVRPAATAAGLKITILDIRDVDSLVAAIVNRHQGQVVLAAGHTSTVPKIIESLGAGTIPPLEETDYDNFFVVTVYAPGKARLLRLKYGESTSGP